MENQQTASSSEGFTTHMKRAGGSIVKQWGSLIPKEFWLYGRDATREMLLAMQSVVEGAIEVIDPDAETTPSPRAAKNKESSKKKINIEG